MKSESITYANMTAALIRELPELKPIYDREMERWGGQEEGPHIVYNDVMYEAIKQQLKSESRADEAFLRKIFAFLEVIANHPDEEVNTVAHSAVCEPICCDEVVLQKAQLFMGKRTREFCAMIIAPNQPRLE